MNRSDTDLVMATKVPNLDAMSAAELLAFRNAWERADADRAQELVGPRPDADRVVALLVRYAVRKRLAIRHRLAGRTIEAAHWEGLADHAYERLPRGVRW